MNTLQVQNFIQHHDTPEVSERTKRLSLLIWEGAHANIFIVMTGGAFLTGIALLFGANDFELGLLTAIPFALQSAQLLSPYLFKNPLKIRMQVANTLVVSRSLWLGVIPLLFFPSIWSLYILIAITALSSILTMVSSAAWLSWMAEVVPQRVRGRFFSRRNAAVAATTVIGTILGSLILDWARSNNQESMGFTAIMLLAVLGGLFAWRAMHSVADIEQNKLKERTFKVDLLMPIRDSKFLKILFVFAVWNFAIGISAAFYAPHMLLNLKLSFFQIGLYSCSAAITAIISSRFWGKFIDKFGSKPILNLCAFGICMIPLVWLFPKQSTTWILIPESLISGVLWSGFNLAAFTLPLDRSPKANRTVYLSVFATTTGLAFFTASILGGSIAEYFADWSTGITSFVFINYHLLFFISAILRIATAILITLFHEPSEVKLPIVVQFMGYAVLKRMSTGRQILFSHPNTSDSENDIETNNKS